MAAARQLGLDLTVASEQASTFETAQPAGLLTLDFLDVGRAVEQARAFAQRHPIASAVGVDDDTVVLATAINAGLDRPTNPIVAAIAARDKGVQRERLAEAGVPVPRSTLHQLDETPETVAAATRYPCVIKPLRLSASRGVIRADDPASFVAAQRRLRDILESCGDVTSQYLVEEYIEGYEVALEGLLVEGRLHVLALFDKPDPLDGPFFEETIYVTPSRHPAAEQEALVACAAAAARALGLEVGPVHAELRLNARGPWLIELAARSIGGRCSAVLRFGNGKISLEEIVLGQAAGLALPSLERAPGAAGVMMIPVPGAGRLQEVQGIAAARAVPGIEDIVITAHRGQELVPWPEGSRYPGFIFARAQRASDVEQALREAHRRLRFLLEPAVG
ncbi:MAG TPA: ATP-grasp domain-containing protein [Gemmatimonadales bacterium]|nr:ATP-grasp domain-containing protein [Gemmatimonadales bacterium]